MKSIKIIQTSDVHSFMFRTDYVSEINQGLLRFERYIQNLRKEHDVLLIDSGDMFQGSPLSHYVSMNLNEYEYHPITTVLNDFKYDVLTLGNHEFNFGKEYIKKSFEIFKGEVLVANIAGIENYIKSAPYKIFEINSLKIAVIGFVTTAVPNFEHPKNIKGITFNSIIDTYAIYEAELQKKSDIIIVNYHGGLECDLENNRVPTEEITNENEGSRLIRKFNSIDILLTGHQHREICTYINNTLVIQPGCKASHIGEITVDSQGIKGDLISIDDKENTNNESIKKLESSVQKYLDNILANSEIDTKIKDIFQARLKGHPLTNFLNQLQIEKMGADVSAVSLFDGAIGFEKEITIRQILANYPYPNTLVVLKVTEEDIKSALEVSASYFEKIDGKITISSKFITPKLQNYQYDLFYGINYIIDTERPIGQRVKNIVYPKNIDKNNIKLVLSSYRAKNYSWYPMYKNKEVLQETSENMVDILIKHLSENKQIKINKKQNFEVK